ncbi:DUF397 domain-containing protein [Sphaerisporangium melleum]|uniref:DUF397 domain-containing protein n=1 Tax=Sphaerisporangium melleum TaxID=321316 RepID=UPI001E4FE075|nr:DUF397 domain-containing protein [Sphaerisporangium melleum]
MDWSRVAWRKSSRSGEGANCVEVARADNLYFVRDSKNLEGPKLAFSAAEWRAFIADLRSGDQPADQMR